jgi:hypothetical protein
LAHAADDHYLAARGGKGLFRDAEESGV